MTETEKMRIINKELEIENEILKSRAEKYIFAKSENEKLVSELESIINSRSYKITQKIKKIIRGRKNETKNINCC